MNQYLKSYFLLLLMAFTLMLSGCNGFLPSPIQNTPVSSATPNGSWDTSADPASVEPVCFPYSPPTVEIITNVDPREITVTNETDVVNGNTENIDTLLANPGADGISLREAIVAGNNTPGPKLITFSPAMKGAVIRITESAEEILLLTSDQFSIDGDVDRDGNPDITLDGSAGRDGTPSGTGLGIASSHNTVTGMIFKDFRGAASIAFSCPSQECAHKTFANNKIIGNTITSQYGSRGINVTPLGFLWPEEAPKLTGIIWRDTLIQDNTIDINQEAGILINPGVGGAGGNRVVNFTISNNHVSGGIFGIAALAADVASDYFGLTDPIYYSDNNSIENLVIAGNTINKADYGIVLLSSNEGDRDNIIKGTLVLNNKITGGRFGIEIHAGGWGGSVRSTSRNIIYNTTIKCNSIHESESGISVEAGHDPGKHFLNSTNDNTIGILEISDNDILQYRSAAIQIIGGFGDNPGSVGASHNIVDGVLITRNIFEASNLSPKTYGVEIIGGWGLSSLTEGNSVQNVSILNNSIQNNLFGISVVGGKGAFAQNCSVGMDDLAGNLFIENSEEIIIANDVEGATGNDIQMPNPLP